MMGPKFRLNIETIDIDGFFFQQILIEMEL